MYGDYHTKLHFYVLLRFSNIYYNIYVYIITWGYCGLCCCCCNYICGYAD